MRLLSNHIYFLLGVTLPGMEKKVGQRTSRGILIIRRIQQLLFTHSSMWESGKVETVCAYDLCIGDPIIMIEEIGEKNKSLSYFRREHGLESTINHFLKRRSENF
jgi:hypothetical protein